MAIYNGTLVKLNLSEKFLELVTYNRAHGRRGRFLIDPGPFTEWLEYGEGRLYEEDIGYMVAMKRGDLVHLKLLWYHNETGKYAMYAVQRIEIPAAVMQSALSGKPVRFLYNENLSLPKLDFSSAAETIRGICADSHKRRALSKALRNSFQWRGSRFITFCGDSPPDSFFFREQGGVCGGLILHRNKKQTKAGEVSYYEYSVHT